MTQAVLLEALATAFAPVAARLSGDAATVEDRLLAEHIDDLHGPLGSVRRRAVQILRQIEPQQRMLARLQLRPPPWFEEDDRQRLADQLQLARFPATQSRCQQIAVNKL